MWGEMLGGAGQGAGMGYMFGGTPTGALIGAAAGGTLGLLGGMEKKKQYKKDVELAARTNELSPWTGMQGRMPARHSQYDALLKGVGGGAMAFGAKQRADQQQQLINAYAGKEAATAATAPGLAAGMEGGKFQQGTSLPTSYNTPSLYNAPASTMNYMPQNNSPRWLQMPAGQMHT